jgi:F-type H+-transporting ATPase subunit delta
MPGLSGSGARRYAEALLQVATVEKAVPAYRQSLDRLATALGPGVIKLLRDPRVPMAGRRAALDTASTDEPPAIRAVLDLLLQRDRIALVPRIASAYSDLVDRLEGVAKAKITTSIALDDAQRGDYVQRLERSSKRKIRATFTVDPSLIGGAKVQVGDRLIDASLRNQLDDLARQLAG